MFINIYPIYIDCLYSLDLSVLTFKHNVSRMFMYMTFFFPPNSMMLQLSIKLAITVACVATAMFVHMFVSSVKCHIFSMMHSMIGYLSQFLISHS